MRETAVSPEHHDRRITRRNLWSSLVIGLGLGIIVGIPCGWFIHQIFARQHAAQVLLCRQQHYGLSEADLQGRCGNVY